MNVNMYMIELDKIGRITSIDENEAGTLKYAAYTYLGAGTIIKVEHPQVSGGLNLTYGESATQPTSSYDGFDNLGRVINQLWQDDSTTPIIKDQFRYGYDRASNRIWKENAITHGSPTLPELDEFYTYDDLNRLINTDRGTLTGTHPDYSAPTAPTFEQDWTLSPTGNWDEFKQDNNGSGSWDLDQAREHNLVNEIGDITEQIGNPAWVTPAHDSAGNMILAPRPSGPNQPTNAESIATEGLILTYDAWNRLRKIHKNDATTTTTIGIGSTSITTADPTLIAEYEYDGINRRIRKILYTEEKLKDEKTGEVTLTTVEDYTLDYYYNTAWQVLEIRKDNDADPLKQYVWDIRYIDSPVLRWHDANEDGDFDDDDEIHYYTTDANMNVTALVDPSDGAVVERYTYDPYGRCTILNGDVTVDPDGIADPTTYPEWSADPDNTSDIDNEILYAGYRYDQESGLFQVRRRYLHVTIGRWVSRDREGYIDGANLYEYCIGSPLQYLDFMGLSVYSAQSDAQKAWNEFMEATAGQEKHNERQTDVAAAWEYADEEAALSVALDEANEAVDAFEKEQAKSRAKSQELAQAIKKQQSKQEGCGRCGPEIDVWLVGQMNKNRNHPVIKRKREGGWQNYIPVFNIGWTAGFMYDFKKLVQAGGPWDFKVSETFTCKGCPTEKCKGTVTICGVCFYKDVPGNIHYGYVGRQAGLSESLIYAGGHFAAPGFQDGVEDRVAISIGIEMANSASALCPLIWAKQAQLNKIKTKGCNPCKKKY